MNNKFVSVLFVVISLCMGLLACNSADAPCGRNVPEHWEYMLVDSPDFYQLGISRLNELGAEGWELVATHGNDSISRFFFKRKL